MLSRRKIISAVSVIVVLVAGSLYWLKTNAAHLEITDSQIKAINYFGEQINSLPNGLSERIVKIDDFKQADNEKLLNYLEKVKKARVRDINEIVASTPDSSYLVINSRDRYSTIKDEEGEGASHSSGFYDYKTVLYDKNLRKVWESPYIGPLSWGRTMISDDGRRVLIINERRPSQVHRTTPYKQGPYMVVLGDDGDVVFEPDSKTIEGAALSGDGRYLAYLETPHIAEEIILIDLKSRENRRLDTKTEGFSEDRCQLAAKQMSWYEGKIYLYIYCIDGNLLWEVDPL
ncbi:MAG: hypothetical protein ACLFN5_04655 [bacterium]